MQGRRRRITVQKQAPPLLDDAGALAVPDDAGLLGEVREHLGETSISRRGWRYGGLAFAPAWDGRGRRRALGRCSWDVCSVLALDRGAEIFVFDGELDMVDPGLHGGVGHRGDLLNLTVHRSCNASCAPRCLR